MSQCETLVSVGREVLARMATLSKSVTIYPQKHPAITEPAAAICAFLEPLLAVLPRVTFNIVKSDIYIESHLLREESIRYSDMILFLTQRGLNSIAFERGVTPEMVTIFFSMLYAKEPVASDAESLKKRLEERGVTAIGFGKLIGFDLGEGAFPVVDAKSSPPARAAYGQALRRLESVEQDIVANKSIDVVALRKAVTSLMGDFLSDREAVLGMMSMKNYDEYLFHHSVNVAIISLSIAQKISLGADTIKTIGVCGLLHDIGKIKIPREITNKPGGLTEAEWVVMRRHPIEGAQMLMRYENVGELPVLAALEHHAGYDLSGYPTLKSKSRPHAIARIISVADIYEALTANRSYRAALNMHRAVSIIIENAGRQLDPLLVKLLLNTFGAFPPGSLVRLKSGEAAVVVEPNEDNPFSPKVRVLGSKSEDATDEQIIDTSQDPTRYAVVGLADSSPV